MAGVRTFSFQADDGIPNSGLPLVAIADGVPSEAREGKAACALLRANGWGGNWIWGVYDFWHFHTRGHEVLACVSGRAQIGFGGEKGTVLEMSVGDVVVIPAGVGHKCMEASEDFQVAGGYPTGQEGNIVRPGEMDRQTIEREIAALAPPAADPIEGSKARMAKWWPSSE